MVKDAVLLIEYIEENEKMLNTFNNSFTHQQNPSLAVDKVLEHNTIDDIETRYLTSIREPQQELNTTDTREDTRLRYEDVERVARRMTATSAYVYGVGATTLGGNTVGVRENEPVPEWSNRPTFIDESDHLPSDWSTPSQDCPHIDQTIIGVDFEQGLEGESATITNQCNSCGQTTIRVERNPGIGRIDELRETMNRTACTHALFSVRSRNNYNNGTSVELRQCHTCGHSWMAATTRNNQ
jgi:hypothetical protein